MLRFITTLKMYGVKVKIKVFILIFCVSSAVTQTCDSSSDVTQCSDGEICSNNMCKDALYCELGGNANCASGLACTSTGQCVHGQVCSQDTNWGRRCVYPVVLNTLDGSEFTFAFQESVTPGSYKQILWYKGGKNFFNRIAAIHPIITDNETLYWHQFCSAHSPCLTSERAHLNISTGELTIHSVELSDEGLYYYTFLIAEDVYVPAVKYEYKLNVYVTGNNHVMIAGCVIGALVLVALVIVGVNVCKRYKVKFYLKFQPRSERAEHVSTVDNVVDNGGYEDPANNNANLYEEVNNGENIVNQYQGVNNGGNIGNQYQGVNNGEHNGNQYQEVNNGEHIGNQYQEVNIGANIGNQYDIINGGNNGNQYNVINGGNIGNQYQDVNNGGNIGNQYNVINGANIGNQYQDVNNGGNIGNQYDVINGRNIGNQYDVINEDAMAMPRGAGFVNLGMTTYEEVL